MTELPRLLEASNDPATRSLLEAGLEDRAPVGFADAIVVGLGLTAASSTALAASGVTAIAAKTAVLDAPAAALAPSASLPSLLGVAKALAIGALVGAVGSGGYVAATGPTASPPAFVQTSASDARARVPASPGVAAPALARDEAVAVPLAASEAPMGEERSRDVARKRGEAMLPSPGAAQAPVAPKSQDVPAMNPGPPLERHRALELETRLVDGARKALAVRDTARASELLDSYDQSRVLGVLDREAWVLRVELLLARGNFDAARALAERFERAYPHDAHNVRLRALIAAASRGEKSLR